jgi:hypothetical protein
VRADDEPVTLVAKGGGLEYDERGGTFTGGLGRAGDGRESPGACGRFLPGGLAVAFGRLSEVDVANKRTRK